MSEMNFELLEKNIRNLMENKKVTQSELAKITGMTQANISKALNPNEKKRFTLDQVFRIAQHFEISIDELVGNTAPEKKELSPQYIFRLIVKLLCEGVVRTVSIEETETVYEPFFNDHGFNDCKIDTKPIKYTAFYFADYIRMSDFSELNPQDETDIHFEFCGAGNDTKYKKMNEVIEKMLPMIKHYRNKEIPEEAFQMIVEGYIKKLF